MPAEVTHFVFTFDRVSGRLTSSRPVGYESISEAEKAAKVNTSEHAGALVLTLTVDQDTGSLLHAKVLCAFGEFDIAAVIDAWGEDGRAAFVPVHLAGCHPGLATRRFPPPCA